MIKVNERFSVEQDHHNWILYETSPGKDKKGNDKPKIKMTYHPNIKFVAKHIIDRTAGGCSSMEEVITGFDNAVSNLSGSIAEYRGEPND